MSKKAKEILAEKGKNQEWKNMDLSKVLSMDLTAAISLLNMIRDTPEVYQACLKAIEAYRDRMVLQEEKQKELDELEAQKKAAGLKVN